jgi:hypothetical protein
MFAVRSVDSRYQYSVNPHRAGPALQPLPAALHTLQSLVWVPSLLDDAVFVLSLQPRRPRPPVPKNVKLTTSGPLFRSGQVSQDFDLPGNHQLKTLPLYLWNSSAGVWCMPMTGSSPSCGNCLALLLPFIILILFFHEKTLLLLALATVLSLAGCTRSDAANDPATR